MRSISLTGSRRGLATLLAAFVLLGMVTTAEDADAATRRQVYEKTLHNQTRKAMGRRVLKMDSHLNKVATRHARRMANQGYLYHNPNLTSEVKKKWRVLGENVGVVYKNGGMKPSLEELHQAFMDSRPHRKNVLKRRYRKAGFGVVGRDGKFWVTVVFLG